MTERRGKHSTRIYKTYLQAETEASPPCPSADPTVPSTGQFDLSPATKPDQRANHKQTADITIFLIRGLAIVILIMVHNLIKTERDTTSEYVLLQK